MESTESDEQVAKRFVRRRRRSHDSGMLVLPLDPVDAWNLERGPEHARTSMIDSADQPLLQVGAESILYAILDSVVDGYTPSSGASRTTSTRSRPRPSPAIGGCRGRIYELTREVIEFQRPVRPLVGILQALTAGFAKYRTDGCERRRHSDQTGATSLR
jgi:hypothetical protein